MFQIARTPGVHGFEHRPYAESEGREGIFNAGRDDGIDLAVHKSIGLKLPELLCEHFRRCSGHGTAKFGKAQGPGHELPEYERLVLAAHEGKCGFHRAMVVGTAGVFCGNRHVFFMVAGTTAVFFHGGILLGTLYRKSAFLLKPYP
jgi:hypothetical protein